MEQQTISQLIEGALAELKRLSYAEISIRHFRQAFTRIARYATKSGEMFLTDNLTERYLLEVLGWDINSKGKPTAHITNQLRVIRILKVYENYGYIPGRIANHKEPPDCFKNHFDLHMSECASRGLSSRTIVTRTHDICELLMYAKSKGLTNIAEIDMDFLDEYLTVCSGKAPRAMGRILSSLRCFLRCMFTNSIIPYDLSFFIPSGSRYPTKSVQKLWSSEEINSFLGAVDRSDSKGKRDYAIILLVVKYGIRAGDVLNLKLVDINWDAMAIQFRQDKTSAPNVLPILDDIGWALADWITIARPKQASTNHVFTRLSAPYCGMKSLSEIFKKRMTIARISRTGCGKSGPHSLRHALASHMLAGQVPLPVITAILGHSSSASTKVYLHSDVEGLRQCALDCPVREGRL